MPLNGSSRLNTTLRNPNHYIRQKDAYAETIRLHSRLLGSQQHQCGGERCLCGIDIFMAEMQIVGYLLTCICNLNNLSPDALDLL
jgi:hypothetical protein